ncbi:Uncharacterised protein [Legionella beliardensis]|uniref:Uncharacterized protein n=1 Tax=Legionella beliardensis TaxID=91822 RepID=A0A378I2E0_9GAMM|nr:hypothetical protein [Legionella beliardensis]STX28855.1 Uncharacterised protein [Legionella beliardensis]
MPIVNRLQAEQAWANFKRISYSPKRERYVAKLSEIEAQDYINFVANRLAGSIKFESPDSAAYAIQSFWHNQRTSDKKIWVNPRGNHSQQFIYFLNGQFVKKSLNKAQVLALEIALQAADWDAAIFSHRDLPHIALALFAADKISHQQMCTTLERHYVFKDFKPRKTYRILDSEGNFTEAAKTILLPAVTAPKQLPLSDEQLESFRLLVLTLEPSEQIFYTTETGHLTFDTYDKSLGHDLLNLGSLYVHKYEERSSEEDNEAMLVDKKELVCLSTGAFDALGIARFEQYYVRPISRLGVLSVDDIMQGVRFFTRSAAMAFPGTPNYENIHKFKNVTLKEALDHDRFHSLLMSKTPKCLIQALWHISDNLKQQTQLNINKEIWHWHDAEFTYAYDSEDLHNALTLAYGTNSDEDEPDEDTEKGAKINSGYVEDELAEDEEKEAKNNSNYMKELGKPISYLYLSSLEHLSIEDNTDLFCRMLSIGKDLPTNGGFLFLINKGLTTAGILTFINLVKAPDVWLNFNIDPQFFIAGKSTLLAPFKESYEMIKGIFSYIEQDKPEVQVLKCMIYINLLEQQATEHFPILCHYINNHPDLTELLQFKKLTSQASWANQFPELLPKTYNSELIKLSDIVNLTVLTFNNDSLVTPVALNKWISSILEDCISHSSLTV